MPSSHEPPLTPEERSELERRADEFHEALSKKGSVSWGEFYIELSQPLRGALLAEMVVLDLSFQWRKGQKPFLEDYLQRFPELGSLNSIPLHVIVEEYRCRRSYGEKISESDIQTRFPTRSAEVLGKLNLANETQVGGTTPIKGRTRDVARPVESTALSMQQQYDLVKKLGAGMFGEVWLAKKMPSGIDKAIKIVTKPADREEAQRELKAVELIKNLRHPFLLATEDFWVSDNRLHIVMELAEDTLRGLLKKHQGRGERGLPPGDLMVYIREASDALDFLHSMNVTHRDVKPDNILIVNRHAKVADFGLARQQERVMQSMSFAGTPAYMAPEIWSGEGGPASDQYSLAMVTAELRQGEAPLKPKSMTEMMFAHLEGKYEFADFVTEAERKVFRKALSKDPKARYANCTAFAEAYAVALGLSQGHRPAPVVPPDIIIQDDVHTTGSMVEQNIPTHPFQESANTPITKRFPKVLSGTQTKQGTGAHSSIVDTKFRPKPKNFKPLIAGGVVLGLVLLIGGIVIAAINGGGGKPTTSNTMPTDPTTPTVTTPTNTSSTQSTNPHVLTDIWLPAGAKAVEKSEVVELANGRKVHDAIQFTIGKEVVLFRLLVQAGSSFYMMEEKVWVSLYAEGGGKYTLADNPVRTEAPGPNEPAFGMNAFQAQSFARSVFMGSLPTSAEWDIAAGLIPPRASISLPGAAPAVNVAKPAPVRGVGSTNDFTPSPKLHDLTGNGREFTETVLDEKREPTLRLKDPAQEKPEAQVVVLRGRMYTLPTGLTLADLTAQQKQPQTNFAHIGSPYTTFRVVIRIPPK